MIVDSSALVAVLRDEPLADRILDVLDGADRLAMGAPTYVETCLVIDARKNPALSRHLDELVAVADIEIVPFTAEHARRAREAFREYGRGSGHPAHLNLGDCYSYAVASVAHEPLLFVGDDFTHTDIRAALG